MPVTVLKKRLRHWGFPLNFTEFLKTTFLQNISGRLSLFFSYFFLHFHEKVSFLSEKSYMNVNESQPKRYILDISHGSEYAYEE